MPRAPAPTSKEATVGERPAGLDWIGFALVLGGAALTLLQIGPLERRPR